MKYDPIPATPDVIRWARDRAGFSLAEARQTFKNIEAWKAGEASPSYPQLEKLADKMMFSAWIRPAMAGAGPLREGVFPLTVISKDRPVERSTESQSTAAMAPSQII